MEKEYYLILDIGGTKTTGAVFTRDGHPVNDFFLKVPSVTYEGENAVFENTVAVGRRVLQETGIDASQLIAIGAPAPGPLDHDTGLIIDVPMMGWKNFPLGELLSKEFGVPAFIENDGNLGALAEQRAGVAKGEKSVLYMTVSTGCGGGIVFNGEIYRGHNGDAGEFGHMSIDYDGLDCGCGGKGCLELYASGTAMNRRMRADMKNGVKSLVFEKADFKEENINGAILMQAAEEGDEYAIKFFKQEGRYLGAGLGNLFNLFDPDVFVLGGGVTKSSKWFIDDMMEEINKRCCREVEKDRIRFSEMNDLVTLYGAYFMVHDYMTKQ